jgi:hypothetical protein
LISKQEQFYKQQIADLQVENVALKEQVAELLKVNAELTEKVAKLSGNSSNSSKPPSSDIVKPQQNTKSNTPRKIGTQPGHTKHEGPGGRSCQICPFELSGSGAASKRF